MPHICDKCSKIFKKKSHYLRHLSRKTPCDVNDKPDDPGFKSQACQDCGKIFHRKHHYLRHINRVTPCHSSTQISYIKIISHLLPRIESRYKVLDLFCGCGGLSKGLDKAGLNIIAGIDYNPKAIETYNSNFSHPGLNEDLTTFSPDQFLNVMHLNKSAEIDIIVGGPPCQGFSTAGRRDPNDPRNTLFMEYIKYLNYFKPKMFVMENVMGILSMTDANNQKVFNMIIEMLSENYHLIWEKVYMSDYGIPQNRRRVIILGLRKDFPLILVFFGKRLDKKDIIPLKEILEPKDQVDKSYYLKSSTLNRVNHKSDVKSGFEFKILNMELPSPTIMAKQSANDKMLIQYNETEIRRLTVTELKRIQSFPEDFNFVGNKEETIRQIGNAIPPLFGYYLGLHLIQTLSNLTLV